MPDLFANIAMPKDFIDGQLYVVADDANLVGENQASFQGNVEIFHLGNIIQAQSADLDQQQQFLNANGAVIFQNDALRVRTETLMFNQRLDHFRMNDSEYQIVGMNGSGHAKLISLSQTQGVNLQDVSFSTCQYAEPDWHIEASDIAVQPEEVFAIARHTKFYVSGIPVMYLPYFAFPISEQRQSGFLFPLLSSNSTNGLDLRTPYYLNLAANYDATILPRLMSNRGLMMGLEGRYLLAGNRGLLAAHYLANDQQADNRNRYFLRFMHQGYLANNWLLKVNYNTLSDANYLLDFGSPYFNKADIYLPQQAELSYQDHDLQVSIRWQDFDFLQQSMQNYRAVPAINWLHKATLGANVHLYLEGDLSVFEQIDKPLNRAERMHLQPTLTWQHNNAFSHTKIALTHFFTAYWQDNLDQQLRSKQQRHINQIKIENQWFFQQYDAAGQLGPLSVSPRFKYLNRSYAEQDMLGIYDTDIMLNDIHGFFRDRVFSGLDRITDAEQLLFGLETRWHKPNSMQSFALQTGYLHFFRQPSIFAQSSFSLPGYALDADMRFNQFWTADIQSLWNKYDQRLENGSWRIRYAPDEQRFLQLRQRYVRNLADEKIDQLGFSASWPINERWRLASRLVQDRVGDRNIDRYIGLEYRSCCWSVQIVSYRNIVNRYAADISSTKQYDSGIMLNFSFNGLSNPNKQELLADGLFGNRRSYLLTPPH